VLLLHCSCYYLVLSLDTAQELHNTAAAAQAGATTNAVPESRMPLLSPARGGDGRRSCSCCSSCYRWVLVMPPKMQSWAMQHGRCYPAVWRL